MRTSGREASLSCLKKEKFKEYTVQNCWRDNNHAPVPYLWSEAFQNQQSRRIAVINIKPDDVFSGYANIKIVFSDK